MDKAWREHNIGWGIYQVEVVWADFYKYIHEELLEYPSFVFRGQRDSTWKLETSLDRLLRTHPNLDVKEHLDRFRRATLGRRGANPRTIADPREWWSLGQHMGLATPILDWTTSPFVAAFFAYAEEGEVRDAPNRVVWAMDQEITTFHSRLLQVWENNRATPVERVEFFRPETDDNPRLLSQNGLFSIGPAGRDLESWVKKQNPKRYKQYILIKIELPSVDRDVALRALNKMNINYLSLFPDIGGSCLHANLESTIVGY